MISPLALLYQCYCINGGCSPNWKLATLELATFPHWQHFHPPPARCCFRAAGWGERTRLRALRVAFGNVPSKASPLRYMSSASRRLAFTSPMTSPLALLCQSYCVNGGFCCFSMRQLFHGIGDSWSTRRMERCQNACVGAALELRTAGNEELCRHARRVRRHGGHVTYAHGFRAVLS